MLELKYTLNGMAALVQYARLLTEAGEYPEAIRIYTECIHIATTVYGNDSLTKGDNSPSISKDNIESWLYPIPPYEEQKVICKKIKSIFSKIEAIEKSLS